MKQKLTEDAGHTENQPSLPICKTFSSIAVPATIHNTIISLGNFLAAFVLSLTGETGIAASGLFSSLQMLLQSFIYSFLFVLGPLAAQISPNEENYQEKNSTLLTFGILLSIVLSIPMTAWYYYSEEYFIATGQGTNISHVAGEAFELYTWGCWAEVALIPVSHYAIARKEHNAAMLFTLVQKALTLILAYYLVLDSEFSVHMGPKGLGLSYSIFSALTLIGFISYLVMKKSFACANLKALKRNIHQLKDILRFGWPISLHMGSELAVLAWLMQMAGQISSASLTAVEIVCQYTGFAIAVIIGLSQGTGMLTSQFAKRPLKIQQVMRIAMISSSVLSALVLIAFIAFPQQLTEVFLQYSSNSTNSTGEDSTNQEVKDISTEIYLIMAISTIPDNLRNIHTGALRGLMDTTVPMLANVIQSGICLGLAYLLINTVPELGASGLYIARGVSIALLSAYLWVRWEKKQPSCPKPNSGTLFSPPYRPGIVLTEINGPTPAIINNSPPTPLDPHNQDGSSSAILVI